MLCMIRSKRLKLNRLIPTVMITHMSNCRGRSVCSRTNWIKQWSSTMRHSPSERLMRWLSNVSKMRGLAMTTSWQLLNKVWKVKSMTLRSYYFSAMMQTMQKRLLPTSSRNSRTRAMLVVNYRTTKFPNNVNKLRKQSTTKSESKDKKKSWNNKDDRTNSKRKRTNISNQWMRCKRHNTDSYSSEKSWWTITVRCNVSKITLEWQM